MGYVVLADTSQHFCCTSTRLLIKSISLGHYVLSKTIWRLVNNFRRMSYLLGFFVLMVSSTETLAGDDLNAYFSQNGIKGDVRFIDDRNTDSSLTIRVDLKTLMDAETGLYNWAVYDLPVEYTKPIACDQQYLGEKILDLTQTF